MKRATGEMSALAKSTHETMTGVVMLEQLQQVTHDSKAKETAPETQREIMRDELKGTQYEMAYIDTTEAVKKESGVDDIMAAGRAAGISDENIKDTIEQGGTLAVPVECYAQSEASNELLDSVSFSPEGISMSKMKTIAEETEKQISEQLTKEAEQRDKAIMEATQKIFTDNEEERSAAEIAASIDPENPSRGLNTMIKEYEQQRDDILAPAMNALRSGMKQGVDIIATDEEGVPLENQKAVAGGYARVSNNAEWYRKFYAKNGRAPYANELRDMARAMTLGDDDAPDVEGWSTSSLSDAERQSMKEGMEETRAQLDEIEHNIELLNGMKERMKKLNGIEMRLTEGLTKEGFEVYHEVQSALLRAGGKQARAARMAAILFARHADIYAAAVSEKTGKKYTAKNYYDDTIQIEGGNNTSEVANQAEANLRRDEAQWSNLIDEYDKADKKEWRKSNNGTLYQFMKVPLVLQLLNIKYDDIKAYGSFFEHSANKRHEGMTLSLLKALPRAMSDPLMILEGSKPNSYVFVVGLKAEKTGATIIAPVEIDKLDDNNNAVINVINTAYGKDRNNGEPNFQWFTNKIKDGNGLLYLNKKKSIAWFEAYQGDFPAVLQTSDALSKFILSDRAKDVKTEEDLAQAKQANPSLYQTAWHGSAHDFDSCDLGKIGSGAGMQVHGWGLYFAKDKKISEDYKERLAAEQIENGGESEARLYEAEIPQDDVMLDENKSFDEQPPKVKKALKKLIKSLDMDNLWFDPSRLSDSEIAEKVLETFRESDGQSIYGTIADNLDGAKEASLALNKAGIKGIAYNEQGGRCYVVFDDKAVGIIEKYNQAANQSIQGRTDLMSNGKRMISIMETADESTFIHEMAHVFLMDLENLARMGVDISEHELGIVAEWADWHKSDAYKLYKDTPWYDEFRKREDAIIDAEQAGDLDERDKLIRVWKQERFARAFEIYMKEGKAPSKGLRGIFRKFRQFLVQIYRSFVSDGSKASPQVEAVMARMIATEDEIRAAELDDRYKDVTKAGGEKLFTETEEETYQRWHEEAAEEAKAKLLKNIEKEFDARIISTAH